MASRKNFYDWYYSLKKGDLVLNRYRQKGVVWHVKDNPDYERGTKKARIVQVKFQGASMLALDGQMRDMTASRLNSIGIWPYVEHLDCANDVPFPWYLFHKVANSQSPYGKKLLHVLAAKHFVREDIYTTEDFKRKSKLWVRSDKLVPLCLDLYERIL